MSFNGLQFGQNLLLSRWVDKLEADENDNSAMWAYIGISFGVIAAVFCRREHLSITTNELTAEIRRVGVLMCIVSCVVDKYLVVFSSLACCVVYSSVV